MKKVNRIFFVVFFGIGLIFFIVSVISLVKLNDFFKTSKTTSGYIEDIYSYRTNYDDPDYRVEIEYNVGSKTYHTEINEYSSSMDIGDKIKVYYNPESPNQIKTKFSYLFIIIFGSVGFMFLCIGLGFFLKNRIGAHKLRKLRQESEPVDCIVSDIRIKNTVTVNGRHPYVVYVQYKDIFSSKNYILKSEMILDDPSQYISIGQSVPVYIDSNNVKRYYVDVAALMPENI